MNKLQGNRFNMYKDTLQIFENYKSNWETNAAVLEVVTQIKELVGAIETKGAERETSTLGTTIAKNKAREQMAQAAAILAAAGYAHAVKKKDATLQAIFDYSYSTLLYASDNDSMLRSQAILDGLAPIVSELSSSEITQVDLDHLKTTIDTFKTSIGLKGSAKSQQISDTQTLNLFFSKTDKLLSDQLDKLMLRYSVKTPDFYAAYEKARVVKNLGVRHKKEAQPQV